MTDHLESGHDKAAVAILGLGPMGRVLAEVYLDRGHPTTVWNRTAAKAAPLVARGARLAASVDEAVAAADVTIVCLNDYASTARVLRPVGEGLRGRTVVNLTSGTPSEARETAAWMGERGARYLDGAIMVPPPLVGEPGSVFLYSGPREVFDEHRATLAGVGDPRYLGAGAELAVLYNTGLLEMMYATMNGWLHATALIDAADLPVGDFAELAFGWFVPMMFGPSTAGQAKALAEGSYPGDLGTLEMNINALEHITRTSVEQGVPAEQPRLMLEIAERAVAQGRGGQNYLAVYEVFKKRAADAGHPASSMSR
ncbi:NAD(P)-dependent oxidoreductase [Nonomuraea endophytica]|uniref:NAD(P)-dependent oxidoreductase n=1 Tax=Nonomuraea endophytica TaxID=714136 RepID=UPI0037C6396D